MDRMRTGTSIIAVILAVSASPGPMSPGELIRRGNTAFHDGHTLAAERCYAQASVRTDDPGLVAFNTAAVRFAEKDYRAAEVHYLQVLSDPAVPSTRRAKAEFNRGVCLLHRGGDAKVYRDAIAAFDAALVVPETDAGFAADVRHNLELAKLLWVDARRELADPPPANAPSPEPYSPPTPDTGTEPDLVSGEPGASAGDPTATGDNPASREPSETSKPSPGAGTLPVLDDKSTVTPLSAADTRALLDRAAARLRRDRRANARLLAGPERPDVRDW